MLCMYWQSYLFNMDDKRFNLSVDVMMLAHECMIGEEGLDVLLVTWSIEVL